MLLSAISHSDSRGGGAEVKYGMARKDEKRETKNKYSGD